MFFYNIPNNVKIVGKNTIFLCPCQGCLKTTLIIFVASPFFDYGREVFRQFRLKQDILARNGMFETQRLGVQSLTWHKVETVTDELLVFGKGGAFENAIAAV
jgi:hypothetical protein